MEYTTAKYRHHPLGKLDYRSTMGHFMDNNKDISAGRHTNVDKMDIAPV
jgi:hypothetical protein